MSMKNSPGVLERFVKRLSAGYELRVLALIAAWLTVLLLLISYLLLLARGSFRNQTGIIEDNWLASLSPLTIFITTSLLSILLGTYTFALFLNRTQRIEKQHKKEVEKTKNELLALASHQLRTPASGVKQYLGMVLEGYTGDLKPEQKRMLKKAYNSNERQIETINQLLYVAQADAGELRLMPSTFNLSALVKAVIQDQRRPADEKNIEIKFSRAKSVYVHGDKRFLRMIIENLVSNATKYSFESSIIEVSVSRQAKTALVKVRDHGVGIAERDFPQLFLKFTRIENELSHSVGGSGIGLFLSQRLAKAHRGSIQVESTKSKGSTFTLVLPVASEGSKKIGRYAREFAGRARGVSVG